MARISAWVSISLLLVVFGGLAVLASVDNSTIENDAEEHVETFEELEKRLKSNVGSLVRRVLPVLMKGSSDAQVSGQCSASIIKVIGGLRQLKEWAMRLIDATGKLPPGILEGTSLSMGDFDECLDIKVGKRDEIPEKHTRRLFFSGKYCLLEFHRPETINRAIADFESGNLDTPIAKTKTFLNLFVRYKHLTNATMKLGVCVPSKCSRDDIENVVNSESLREHIGNVHVAYCQAKNERETSTEQTIFSVSNQVIFGFIVSFLLLTTAADAFLRLRNDGEDLKPERQSSIRLMIQKTSLYGNAMKVLSTKRTSESLQCLSGLRTLIIMMIIYSHTYGYLHKLHFQKYSKAANFLRFFESFTFLESVMDPGITITYNRWRFVSKENKVKLNIFRMLLSRYFRMSAAQILAISVFLLFPLIGTGPIWTAYMTPELTNCRKRWWINLLYIGNFYEPKDVCLYHTSRRCGIFFIILLILSGVFFVGIMTVIHELPGSLAFYMLDKRTFPIAWTDVFIKPLDHIGPFCVGLLTGYYLAMKKEKLDISRIMVYPVSLLIPIYKSPFCKQTFSKFNFRVKINQILCRSSIFLWCSSIACTTAVMFGLYSYRHGDVMETPLATFYAIMHRNVWCSGIAWIVIACTTHHGGPVSRVLKCRFFVTTDRLCYMAYLIHLPVMHFRSASIRERWYLGHLETFFMATSYIVIAFMASLFLNIIFVEPYYVIEKHVATFFRPNDKVIFETKTQLNEISIPDGSANNKSTTVSNGVVHTEHAKTSDVI
ncbi:nose resistant to fluoxetine protein 6 [Caerostris extrusa]|uniref:Nose resistant to fluoxetine protein 6 n=1 Tax=Caerostris extrusa TaxID=172846 RepID=A0AAV4QJG0_CAEEX|nr:nose resistant to fluoxetine protein 6 [Caerostris extrusa]